MKNFSGVQRNYSTFQISTQMKSFMANFYSCLSVLFSTKCQKCLDKYRSNSISYGLHTRYLFYYYHTSLYLWKFNSTACCLVTKPGSLLLPPPLFSKPVPPPPPPTHPWRKLAQHAHNTRHLVNMKEVTN